MAFLQIILLVLHFCVWNCQASNIIVYEQSTRISKNASINIFACSNLKESGINDVDFIHLNGTCARLYNQNNCSGQFIETYRDVPDMELISEWEKTYLNDEVKSVGPCPNPCYQQTYDYNNSRPTIEMYRSQNYIGTVYMNNKKYDKNVIHF